MLSKDILFDLLASPPSKQQDFWTDQIHSERSYPLGTFRDRASDSLLCSLLAWDPLYGKVYIGAFVPNPYDVRITSLFETRTQIVETRAKQLSEEYGWFEEDEEDFRAKSIVPADVQRAQRAAIDAMFPVPVYDTVLFPRGWRAAWKAHCVAGDADDSDDEADRDLRDAYGIRQHDGDYGLQDACEFGYDDDDDVDQDSA